MKWPFSVISVSSVVRGLFFGYVCIGCWRSMQPGRDHPTAITMKHMKIMKRFRFSFMGFMGFMVIWVLAVVADICQVDTTNT